MTFFAVPFPAAPVGGVHYELTNIRVDVHRHRGARLSSWLLVLPTFHVKSAFVPATTLLITLTRAARLLTDALRIYQSECQIAAAGSLCPAFAR